MEPWGNYFITFLIGVATGAAGEYYAAKYTDKRRNKEKANKRKNDFNKIKGLMPDLINEMKDDFKQNVTVRELVILPTSKVIFNSSQPRFSYYENQHTDLKGKIAVLENHHFVTDVTTGNAPIYRITEEFREFVIKS